MSDDWAGQRLAVYGTLMPGESNHYVVASIEGVWVEGQVRGQLLESGWGAAHGFPGIVLDDAGPTVDVWMLESAELPSHWERLDYFEGPGYRRTVAEVSTDGGAVSAQIYVLVDAET